MYFGGVQDGRDDENESYFSCLNLVYELLFSSRLASGTSSFDGEDKGKDQNEGEEEEVKRAWLEKPGL